MAAATFLIIVVSIGLAIVLCSLLVTWKVSPNRKSRREKELEAVLMKVRELAYNSRETDYNLSVIITDEINNFTNKDVRGYLS